jgi:hypothetical protein
LLILLRDLSLPCQDGVAAESRASCVAECRTDDADAAHERACADELDHAECADFEHDVVPERRGWGGIRFVQGRCAHELGADGLNLAHDVRAGVLCRGDDAHGRCSLRLG